MTDLQVAAIEQLARTFDFGHGVRHGRKVAAISTSLFDQLSFRGLIPALMPEDRRLLMAAAFAHDIGLNAGVLDAALPTAPQEEFYAGDGHNVLGCRLLAKALDDPRHARLGQIEPRDWNGLLHCVLWHEGNPHARPHGSPPAETWRVRPLAGMLRLAEALDCRERCVVVDVRVVRAPTWLRLLVRSTCACDAEIAAAQQNSDVLAEALDLRVAVQQVVEEDAPAQNTR
jgi:hypothetical protein